MLGRNDNPPASDHGEEFKLAVSFGAGRACRGPPLKEQIRCQRVSAGTLYKRELIRV